MSPRAPGWESRLAGYLAARRRTPFAWGDHDCCRFACGGLVAQGLADPMRGIRYATERGAQAAIRRLAGAGATLDDAATILAARASLREIAPAFAGRGCPVLADLTTAAGAVPYLGLVDLHGTHALFADHPAGLARLPLAHCRRAWALDGGGGERG